MIGTCKISLEPFKMKFRQVGTLPNEIARQAPGESQDQSIIKNQESILSVMNRFAV